MKSRGSARNSQPGDKQSTLANSETKEIGCQGEPYQESNLSKEKTEEEKVVVHSKIKWKSVVAEGYHPHVQYKDAEGNVLHDRLTVKHNAEIYNKASKYLQRWQSELSDETNKEVRYLLESTINDGIKTIEDKRKQTGHGRPASLYTFEYDNIEQWTDAFAKSWAFKDDPLVSQTFIVQHLDYLAN